MNWLRVKKDLKYILLNRVINHIPSWTVRRFFYMRLGLRISKGARIGICTIVDEPKKIDIGERSVINEYCFLDGRGGLSIGKDVSISAFCRIITASHYSDSSSFEYYEGPVSVGDNVWMGINSIVLDKSTIQKGCIIGAGCVIKGKTEENGIYVGNPAQMIKKRKVGLNYKLDYHPYFR